MREESVSRRYAAALFAHALRTSTLKEIAQDLSTVAEAVESVPALRTLLNQPLVTEERKKATIKAVFGGRIDDSVLSFLNLSVDKRRIELLPQVQREFSRLMQEHENIAQATAVSAVPLLPAEKKALTESLQARTGKRIELKTDVDPALIGGVLVRIGDTVYDGTVRGNLERLRAQLLARR